jgi:hypothetical protein
MAGVARGLGNHQEIILERAVAPGVQCGAAERAGERSVSKESFNAR